jgi:hypothetical protein
MCKLQREHVCFVEATFNSAQANTRTLRATLITGSIIRTILFFNKIYLLAQRSQQPLPCHFGLVQARPSLGVQVFIHLLIFPNHVLFDIPPSF